MKIGYGTRRVPTTLQKGAVKNRAPPIVLSYFRITIFRIGEISSVCNW